MNRKQKWVITLWCLITAVSGFWAALYPFDSHHRLSDGFWQGVILWVASTFIASALWWMLGSKNSSPAK